MASMIVLIALPAFTQHKVSTEDPLRIAVLSIDAKEVDEDAETLGHIARLKLQKLSAYEVLRHYDVLEELNNDLALVDQCFSVKCLTRVGKQLNADLMLTGTAEKFGDRIIINLVIVDVAKSAIIASDVNEYFNVTKELEGMLEISVSNLLNIEVPATLRNSLERNETIMRDQVVERLKLNGPRMGVGYVGGLQGQRLMDPKSSNGFDMLPIMSQFGYQFEWQYLSAGDLQALVEVIPIISGMDQGRFIPSLTIMNGFRHSKSGIEFAFGPTLRINQVADGYYDDQGVWHRPNDWIEANQREDGSVPENPYEVHQNIDSKGWYRMSYGFTLAAGKTFKSGHLNMPVNVYFTPGLHGYLLGTSFGFNVRKPGLKD